ncbi:transposase [Variovorax sp. H27-G14]|uniref:transposase n=1 Tax=Variovorax sp. H27-G14 TaxID=3111914 RepID=UPI0038FCE4C0
MDMMTTASKRRRLERSPELKAMVLAECERPGASVAKVAMAHGVNANLVHGWRRLERERRQAASAALDQVRDAAAARAGDTVGFVPVMVEQSTNGATIEIEFRRGSLTMKSTWPMTAAAQCAAWAREILR